jgi:hypothetical protein
MADLSLDHLPEVSVTQLLWRDQLAALPRALGRALRRLLRLECRQYLTINGQVVARFVSEVDARDFKQWIDETHTATFEYGYGLAREVHSVGKNHVNLPPDAGDPGPA